MKENETLKDWVERIAKEREENGWEFKPFAWYNSDGDSLEVFWSDESDYTEELKGRETNKDGVPYSVMGLRKDFENKIPTGVNVYSIKQILKQSGFEIIPIKKEDE